MSHDEIYPPDETLDPVDWDGMRSLGQRMILDMLDYTKSARERPPWRHAPERVKAHFNTPVPLDPQSPEEIYKEFLEYVLPYPLGNYHPRFWGWVAGTGTVFGAMAELLAASMNTAQGSFAYHSANYVENQVVEWIKEMLGYPRTASGLLTSGCSAANLIGLAVARNAKAGYDLRREGLQAAPYKLVLYASEEIHSSNQKAVELLGLGSDALRRIPVNEQFQIDLDMLRTAIIQDRKEGYRPFCVIGAAGTTNTGAIDDLDTLANICQSEELWLHIDAAFGAWAALVPSIRHLVEGMSHADSVALDLHKWMYVPYEIGCVLVRGEVDHRKTFSLTPNYLAHGEGERGLTGVDLPWFSDYGFQLSRRFRALKAWMSLKEHGVNRYRRLIQQNIDQANYLAELIEATPELDLAAQVSLSVVCFRYVDPGMDEKQLDAMNKEIEIEVQEQGVAVISGTRINGRYVLRVAVTNHRSQREDFDYLVREIKRIGKDLQLEKI